MSNYPRLRRLLLLVLAGVGVAYPFLVYFGLQFVPPAALAFGLLGVLALRLLFGPSFLPATTTPMCWLALAGFVALSVWAPMTAMTAYPVLLSLVLAAVFGYSLIYPPTIIERIARLREPDLPDDAVGYVRKVTLIWLGFFLINAAASTGTALSGDLRLWTIYNGFVSYVLMGVLFTSEFVVRMFVRRRQRLAP